MRLALGIWVACVLAVVALSPGPAAAEPVTAQIGYDAPPEDNFEYQLLDLALAKSGVSYDLTTAGEDMNEARMRGYLAEPANDTVTVAWFGTSSSFERRFRAVYIPLRQGMLGYRLFLIRESQQPAFDKVTSLADLADFVALQGKGWSDVKILREAGLAVTTAEQKYLYRMLAHGRGDYFPRGMGEAYTELAKYGDDHEALAVEESLVITYPFAFFYFVHPQADRLHGAIRQGLETAHADGSYQKLFEAHFGDILERARLDERTEIPVENPFATEAMKDIPDRYWLDPSAYN